MCELRSIRPLPVFTRSILLTICNSSYISYKFLSHFPLHRARLNSFERRLGTRQKQVYSTILYIIFKCSLHVENIAKICGYSDEKYNGYRNIYFIRLYAWLYFPFNSRLRVQSTSYLNSPGYEVGFRCVEWSVEFVGTEVGVFLVVVLNLPRSRGNAITFSILCEGVYIFQAVQKHAKYWYSSCRLEMIFRFKLLNFS